MGHIRQARETDLQRISEIEVFAFRLQFYPVFLNDDYYFGELRVDSRREKFADSLDDIWVYDDGVVKGFVWVDGRQIKKLYVEPVLQGGGIGGALLEHAVSTLGADYLWALEKNDRAIAFYQKHGFALTGEKIPEEDTTEFLVKMKLAR